MSGNSYSEPTSELVFACSPLLEEAMDGSERGSRCPLAMSSGRLADATDLSPRLRTELESTQPLYLFLGSKC